MPVYLNLVIIAAYGIVAAAVAAAAPMPELPSAYLQAAIVFMLGALLHSVAARILRWREAEQEFGELRSAYQDLRGEVEALRYGVVRIHNSMSTAEAERAKDGGHRVSEIISEVRVLQGLVERLHLNKSSKAMVEAEPLRAAAGGGAAMPARRTSRPAPVLASGLDESQVLDIVREGLKADRVDLYLQPIVSLPQRKRRFYECYSRIRGADGVMVTPEQYIDIAEREGLIGAIDNMLLFRCVQLVRKVRLRQRDVGFFCNISPNNLNDKTFFTEFVEFMTQNAELAPNLYFEFSQDDVKGFDAATLRQLRFLADHGFRFSIDRINDLNLDLRWLHDARFAFVKIEAALLIRSIGGERPVLDLKALKDALDRTALDLIVDKVELEDDLRELLDYNLDYAQGYLFGEPRPNRET
jgi:cyclic-di-GMP phosphodiesterase TipF (flagellum assembly factor)